MARITNMSKMTYHDINEPLYEVMRVMHTDKREDLGIDLSDEKSKIKFVERVEEICRQSYEYKELIKFLRDTVDMNRCAFFSNVTNKIKGVKIEIHHEPFSLYDICYIVLEKWLKLGYPIEEYNIANEVMYAHYKANIGLIPLSKTVHQLVHASEIFIPITYVFGNIDYFCKEYLPYMTTNQKEIICRSINIAKDLEKMKPKILKKKFIYLDIDGMVLPAHIDFNDRKVKKILKKHELNIIDDKKVSIIDDNNKKKKVRYLKLQRVA